VVSLDVGTVKIKLAIGYGKIWERQ